ncbi:MAG: hypothetical protein SAJ12_00700 [Jaaginema sp. PMC 1079.18]|nr:hypothetical protein [Jaaginema sp. PMC 1080.18]MEC4849502.1 hypothetical protein [Jaaginema sp. PMC 1079.18]MEC4865619.1 hypothetical protein [Jaaginema sp. PMC 1078.18]
MLRFDPIHRYYVNLASGGIDKLDIYQGLGIAEVWFWQENRLDAMLDYRQALRDREEEE